MEIIVLILLFCYKKVNSKCIFPEGNSVNGCAKAELNSDFPWNFNLLNDHLQSPVDIITSMAVKQDFKPLQFTARNDETVKCTFQNSGHGFEIRIEDSNNDLKPQLSGSFLKDTYIFANLHFHWGTQDYFGSEHFINGESFSLEGHMVMYKKEYRDLTNALRFKDGVAVLTFFAIVGEKNRFMDRMLTYIPLIKEANSTTTVRTADPILWFLPDVVRANRFSDYYAYPGSLTTSPFTESLTFIIMSEPISISESQLNVLRTIKDDNRTFVLSNRRELQPLRGRPLIKSNNIQWTIKANSRINSINNNSFLPKKNEKNTDDDDLFIWT